MTYTQILDELEEVGLREKFQTLFESLIRPTLLDKVKETDKLYSVTSVLRTMIEHLEDGSEECLYWLQVLYYFWTPKFAREHAQLPKPL